MTKNTEIYLWLDPLVANYQRYKKKMYFNCIVEGDLTSLSKHELEDVVEGRVKDIMDFAYVSVNGDFGVISAKATSKDVSIEFAKSPLQIREEKRQIKEEKEKQKLNNKIANIIKEKEPLILKKDNLEIKDNGLIEVSLPALKIKGEIDFSKIWDTLEKDFIGKIKEGDEVKLVDDDGNVIFKILGGSFLNIAVSDIRVYDSEKRKGVPDGIFNRDIGLKGGLMLRDDGSMDVGDIERTFYLKIYTNNLLKASLKMNKSLMEVINPKLLKP